MPNGEEVRMFVGICEDVREAISSSFLGKVALIFICVMLPGALYGSLVFLGDEQAKLQVRSGVHSKIILQDVHRAPFSYVVDLGVQFEQCVSERRRELCLGLLGEQVLRCLTREKGTDTNAQYRAAYADQGAGRFTRQAGLLLSGFGGIFFALLCVWVGWIVRDVF